MEIIRKFNLKSTWKIFGYILIIFGAIVMLSGVMLFIIDSDEVESWYAIFFIAVGLLAPVYGQVFLKRSVCICADKIFGNLGRGLRSTTIEIPYSEILSVTSNANGITIETVKETYVFTQIESPGVCADLIKERIGSLQ